MGEEAINHTPFPDTTGHKPAEEALPESVEWIRDLLENANDLFQSIAPDGHFLYVNRTWQRVLGYSEEEIAKLTMWDIIHPDSISHCRKVFQRVMSGETVNNVEAVFVAKDGKLIPVEGSANCQFGEGKPVFTRGIFRDITERRQAEEKAREAEALKELGRMRTELLANVSHELRTPLATIKGYATMLLDYDTRLRREERRRYLRFIDNASDRLVRLIDQLLDMSQLDTGLIEMEKKSASVSKLLQEVVAETQVRQPRRRLVLNLPKRLPRLNIDAKRVRQVLENLIDNAIKYSEDGTEVVISTRRVKRRLLISVADQGIGIPATDLSRVFDRIYRTQQKRVAEVRGAGLGLSICKRLVEAHRGRIWIESEEGKGTTCCFTLPLTTREVVFGKKA